MIRTWILLSLTLLLLPQALLAMPPCKSAEELRVAVEECLTTSDTNQFWGLHCWTGVSPEMEKLHKMLSVGAIVSPADGKRPHCETVVAEPPPQSNTSQPLKSGGFMKPNIPVTGVIAWKQDFEEHMSAEGFFEFGKGPEGNYWLVVRIKVDGEEP